jgi:hypothetical protein
MYSGAYADSEEMAFLTVCIIQSIYVLLVPPPLLLLLLLLSLCAAGCSPQVYRRQATVHGLWFCGD